MPLDSVSTTCCSSCIVLIYTVLGDLLRYYVRLVVITVLLGVKPLFGD